MTGSEGARLAAEYIAQALQATGLEPFGDDGTYFQTFEFTADRRILPEANTLRVETGEASHRVDADFRPLSFTANADVQGEVVFAGYGLAVPGYQRLRLLRRRGCDGQDRPRFALRTRGCRCRTARRTQPLCGPALQGDDCPGPGSESDSGSRGPQLPERRQADPDDVRQQPRWLRHRRGFRQRRGGRCLVRGGGQELGRDPVATRHRESLISSASFALEGVEVAIETGVERDHGHGSQRARAGCRDRRVARRCRDGRGRCPLRSHRTRRCEFAGAARARKARSTTAPTTTHPAWPCALELARALAKRRGATGATSCSPSGPARSWA